MAGGTSSVPVAVEIWKGMEGGHCILTPDDFSCCLCTQHPCHPTLLFRSHSPQLSCWQKKAGAELNNIAVEKLFSSKTKKAMTIFYLYFQYFNLE